MRGAGIRTWYTFSRSRGVRTGSGTVAFPSRDGLLLTLVVVVPVVSAEGRAAPVDARLGVRLAGVRLAAVFLAVVLLEEVRLEVPRPAVVRLDAARLGVARLDVFRLDAVLEVVPDFVLEPAFDVVLDPVLDVALDVVLLGDVLALVVLACAMPTDPPVHVPHRRPAFQVNAAWRMCGAQDQKGRSGPTLSLVRAA